MGKQRHTFGFETGLILVPLDMIWPVVFDFFLFYLVVTGFLFTAKAVGKKQLGSKKRDIVAALFLKGSISLMVSRLSLTKKPYLRQRAELTLRKFRRLRYR